jgi:hypothetical protein
MSMRPRCSHAPPIWIMRGEMVWRVRVDEVGVDEVGVDEVDVDRIEKRLGRVVSRSEEGRKIAWKPAKTIISGSR